MISLKTLGPTLSSGPPICDSRGRFEQILRYILKVTMKL
jgi:hypothetical protein